MITQIKGGEKVLEAIKEYQVPGCVNDFDENNFVQEGIGYEWSDHYPGTTIFPSIGRIFLGMPKLFTRLGQSATEKNPLEINIFENYDHLEKCWCYDKFNIPCWKYRNEKGHTFVRGLSPRINNPFLHIILEDCLEKINCLEITEKDIEEMD